MIASIEGIAPLRMRTKPLHYVSLLTYKENEKRKLNKQLMNWVVQTTIKKPRWLVLATQFSPFFFSRFLSLMKIFGGSHCDIVFASLGANMTNNSHLPFFLINKLWTSFSETFYSFLFFSFLLEIVYYEILIDSTSPVVRYVADKKNGLICV